MEANSLTINRNIQTFSKWAEWGCLGGAVLAALVIAVALALVVLPHGMAVIPELTGTGDIIVAPTPLQRAVAVFFWLWTDVLGLCLFLCGYGLFRGIRAGALYHPTSAQRVRLLGWIVLAMAPVGLLAEGLGSAAVSWSAHLTQPAGSGRITLSLDDTDVYAVVIGLILICFGHILTQAAELAAENESFV